METTSVLLWGLCALVVTIVLGLLFSKRNSSKKEKLEPPIEVPEKEYSQYNSDEIEEDNVELCSCCGQCEVTEEWNDARVCEDCFDELDNEEDEDDWPKGKTSEYTPTEYAGSGFNLTSLIIGIVVLGITISIGAMILGELTDMAESVSYNTTASNMTSQFLIGTSEIMTFFPIIFIVGLVGITLSVFFRLFGWMRDDGI